MPRYELIQRETGLKKQRTWPVLAGLAMTLLGVPLYVALLDIPLVRSSGFPAFVLMGVGAVVGAYAAWRDVRRWVRLLAGLQSALLVAFTVAFVWLATLPLAAEAATRLVEAPDFTLPDHQGRTVSLRGAYSTGPVLLVFYRGHW